MPNAIVTADTRDIPKLLDVLQTYRMLSKKSWDDILPHEANEWRWALWGEFKKISPKPDAIYEAAKRRGFRVERRGNSITKTDEGVSRAAQAAAESELGTDKSDLFRIEVTQNGVYIKPVRFSSRKSEKFLTGGRTGRKFAAASKRAKDTSAEAIQKARALDHSIKRLNLRALGVAFELSLRSRAAKGGTMALQWLGTNFKRRKSSTVKTGPVVIRSSKGIPLGTVDFDRHGEASQATLSALVPGTARQITRHRIIPKVEAARISDRMEYINKKLAKNRDAAIAKAKS